MVPHPGQAVQLAGEEGDVGKALHVLVGDGLTIQHGLGKLAVLRDLVHEGGVGLPHTALDALNGIRAREKAALFEAVDHLPVTVKIKGGMLRRRGILVGGTVPEGQFKGRVKDLRRPNSQHGQDHDGAQDHREARRHRTDPRPDDPGLGAPRLPLQSGIHSHEGLHHIRLDVADRIQKFLFSHSGYPSFSKTSLSPRLMAAISLLTVDSLQPKSFAISPMGRAI